MECCRTGVSSCVAKYFIKTSRQTIAKVLGGFHQPRPNRLSKRNCPTLTFSASSASYPFRSQVHFVNIRLPMPMLFFTDSGVHSCSVSVPKIHRFRQDVCLKGFFKLQPSLLSCFFPPPYFPSSYLVNISAGMSGLVSQNDKSLSAELQQLFLGRSQWGSDSSAMRSAHEQHTWF